MKKYLYIITLFGTVLFTFCGKKETNLPLDVTPPTIEIISPKPIHDSLINGVIFQKLSNYPPGSIIPIRLNISDDFNLDSITVKLTDSVTNLVYFRKTYYTTAKSLNIDTIAVAPTKVKGVDSPGNASIAIQAFDLTGNTQGKVRVFSSLFPD